MRIFSFLLVFLITISFSVSAATVSPSSGNFNYGSTTTIQLRAQPNIANANAITIRMSISNATITGFTPASGLISIGDCSGGTTFTSNTICVSLAKVTPFTAGENIGSFTVQFAQSGSSSVLTKTSGSQYSDGSNTQADTLGNIGTYYLPAYYGGTLPATSIGSQSLLLLIAGVIFIISGLVIRKRNSIY